MGAKSSIVEQPSINLNKDLLKWKRCVYMTQKEYNSKSYLNENMVCISGTTQDVNNYVISSIKNLASFLPKNKVPAPIYVMYARKLEYNGTIFGDCIDEVTSYSLLNSEQISIVPSLITLANVLITLKLKLMNSKKNINTNPSHLNELKNVLNTLKLKLINSKKNINENPSDLNELNALKNEINEINNKINEINNEINEINEINNKINEINNEINEINDLNALNNEINEINNKINNLKARLQEIINLKANYKCIKDDNLEKYLSISNRLFDNLDSLYSSELSKFNFGSNYEVVIYIPNLNKANNFYFTNITDYSLHNQWMHAFIKNDLLYNIITISDPVVEQLKNLYDSPMSKSNKNFRNMLQNIIKIFIFIQEKQYPFAKELTQSCFNKGCVSDYGEDLEQIVPGYTKDAGQRKLNSDLKAPYYPTKCLRQPNYSINMFDDNEEFKKKLTDNLLGDCLKDFNDSLSKLDNSGTPPSKDIEPLLINQFKKCAVNYKYEKIGKFNSSDGTDAFSVEYNRKILGELSLRKNSYPGVQEVIFPLFRLNEENLEIFNYITYMPWGNILLTKDYVLNLSSELLQDTPLKSTNGTYFLIIPTKNVPAELLHKICVFKNNSIYYTLSDTSFSDYYNKKLVLENYGTLSLYGTKKYNDKSFEIIWSMVVADISKAIQPVSFGFNIENGNLIVLDNGFDNRISVSLTKRISDSKKNFLNSNIKIEEENIESDFIEYLKFIGYNLTGYTDNKGESSSNKVIKYISSEDKELSNKINIKLHDYVINAKDTSILYDDNKHIKDILSSM